MTPKIKVADCRYNTEQIKELITKAYDNKAAIVSFLNCVLQDILAMICSYRIH